MSPIETLEVLSLQVPRDQRRWDCDGTYDCCLVRITDSEGRSGLGEIGGPAEAAAAFLGTLETSDWRGTLAGLLIGQDPREAGALWDRLFAAIQTIGRRGFGVAVISGLDIALHDLAGQQLGLPVYKLLGGAARPAVTPYATIWPGLPHGRTLAALMADIEQKAQHAIALGYRALKVEVMFERLADDAALVACIREARRMVGPDIKLAIDFGYRWRHWRDAAWVLERVADCDLLFAEATLQHDDLEGHARLAARSPVPVCGGELAATRWEIREWIERGRVDIVQPCITRAGGFTEMRRIVELCDLHGVRVVPHGWTCGLGAACQLHLQAASTDMPWVEYLPPELYGSPLRAELVGPEARLSGGELPLPQRPGLGVTLDEAVARRYLAGAPRVFAAPKVPVARRTT